MENFGEVDREIGRIGRQREKETEKEVEEEKMEREFQDERM